MSEIPKLINNDKVIDALSKASGLGKEQIIKQLKWGEGPTLEVIESTGQWRGMTSEPFKSYVSEAVISDL